MEGLYIYYSDEAGIVRAEVDSYGIAFCDGLAYFTDGNGEDHKVPASAIISINQEV